MRFQWICSCNVRTVPDGWKPLLTVSPHPGVLDGPALSDAHHCTWHPVLLDYNHLYMSLPFHCEDRGDRAVSVLFALGYSTWHIYRYSGNV